MLDRPDKVNIYIEMHNNKESNSLSSILHKEPHTYANVGFSFLVLFCFIFPGMLRWGALSLFFFKSIEGIYNFICQSISQIRK